MTRRKRNEEEERGKNREQKRQGGWGRQPERTMREKDENGEERGKGETRCGKEGKKVRGKGGQGRQGNGWRVSQIDTLAV